MKGIGQDDAFKGLVFAGLRFVMISRFDIDGGDVISQQVDLVGVDLFGVFSRQVVGADKAAFQQAGDEGAGADEGINVILTRLGGH